MQSQKEDQKPLYFLLKILFYKTTALLGATNFIKAFDQKRMN